MNGFQKSLVHKKLFSAVFEPKPDFFPLPLVS